MVLGVIQIIGIFFLIFATSRIYLRYKDKKLTVRTASIWGGLWIIIAYFLLFPGKSDILAGLVGIGRGADLIVYVSIVCIYYLLFRLYIRLEETNKNITKIIRGLSLAKKDGSK